MSFRQTTTVWLLFLALITGCSMTHGDPKNPKKNPHPVKRYEVTAMADAPGPWDEVSGYISYEIANLECLPENKFLGVHIGRKDIGLDIEMTQVDEKTWKGYFYRDYLQDEDYYGLGVCHWDAASVGGVFSVRGGTFGSSDVLEVFQQKGPQAEYFRRSEFLDRANTDGGYGTTPDDPEIVQQPKAFFPITIMVKEVKL